MVSLLVSLSAAWDSSLPNPLVYFGMFGVFVKQSLLYNYFLFCCWGVFCFCFFAFRMECNSLTTKESFVPTFELIL